MDKWLSSAKKRKKVEEEKNKVRPSAVRKSVDYTDDNEVGSKSTMYEEHLLEREEAEMDIEPSTSKQVGLPLPVKPKVGLNVKTKIYKFNPSWTKMPEFAGWLQKDTKQRSGSDLGRCVVCDLTISAHKTELLCHGKSAKHVKLAKEISSNKNLVNVVENTGLLDNTKRAEIKLAGLIASCNLPFSLMDGLITLCKETFTNSKIAEKLCLKRTKATSTVKHALGDTFQELLYDKLRVPGCFFSVIMDETTDKASIKQCALTVIYVDHLTGSVKTNFFDIFEMSSTTAEDLYNALLQSLRSKDIPLENLVGFSADTTNVMFGIFNSVSALLKRDFPNIACIKCSCHMIHLAASKACLMLPRSVVDLLRNLGSHFSRSYGRQVALREFQEFFQTEIHKILSPSVTRWLSLK